jgi:4-hydroxybenzoate polyprenyltransferase
LYKRQLVIGNIIVALFAAFVPLLTVIYEIPLLNKDITPTRPPAEATLVSVMFMFVAGYAVFAFLTTLAREILKDIEDIEGDRLSERRTIPVVWGIKTAKIIIIALLGIVIATLGFIYINYFTDYVSLIYISICIVLPVVYVIIKIIKADSKPHYRHISIGMKGIMLAGLLFSVLLWFIL